MSEIKHDRKLVANKLVKKDYGKLCADYMTEYGTYVNGERAVPFIADGLKPVQRRSLFVMHKIGAHSNKPAKKVITITGEALKYHPHGDKSISDVIVTFAHTRYQLLDPQGAFGSSISPAAAARYIEARLSKFGMKVFERLNISPMSTNFDGLELEPDYIATGVPLAALNGYSGIGVGLTAGMPSHNISELTKGLKYLLKNKKPKEDNFLNCITKPDFGHCIITSTPEEVNLTYRNGRGSLAFAPKHKYVKEADGVILVLEGLPPNLNASRVINNIKENYHAEGLIDYIKEMQVDEKTINGIRPKVTIHVKSANKKILESDILPMFNSRFNVSMLVVDEKEKGREVPALSFFEFNQRWVEYQKGFKKLELTALLDKKSYDLKIAEARYKIVSSKSNIEKLIKIVRDKKYKDNESCIKAIGKAFKLDEEQSESLFNIQLRSLSNVNVQALKDKINKLKDEIKEIKKKLKDIPGCIIEDLEELNNTFKDDNNTVFEKDFKVVGDRIKGSMLTVGFSETGKIYTDKFPSNVDFIYRTEEGLSVVGQDGLIREFDLSDLTGSTGFRVAGAVSYDTEYMLVGDMEGKCIVLDMEDDLESKKKAFSDIGDIEYVYGLNKGDSIVVAKRKQDSIMYTTEELVKKFKKKVGSLGKYIMPNCKNDVYVYHLPKDCEPYIDGKKVTKQKQIIKMFDTESDRDVTYLLNENNIVKKGTSVIVVNKVEASSFVSKGGLNEW